MLTRRTATAMSLAAAFLLMVAPAAISAQQPADDGIELGRGGWELNAYGGYIHDTPEFDPAGGTIDLVSGEAILGGRLGYMFNSGLFVQGEFGYSFDHLLAGSRAIRFQSLDFMRWGGTIGWNWQPANRLQIFPVVGAGAVTWMPAISDNETDLGVNGGAGFRYFFTPSFAFRADARYHLVPNAMEDIQADMSPNVPVEDEAFGAYELSAGLSLFFGGASDSDGDGVRDRDDACPDTPRGAEVDAEGCAIDSDSDGVADYRDECPGTPRGAEVDADGCPTDGDGDGVYDGIDECPDTPEGAEVDDTGCAIDDDGDGVPNGIDECPDTPEGAEVDDTGCITRVVLDEVLFDFDSANIRDDAEASLRDVGRALARLAPDGLEVEIRGHTDSVGPDSYNMQLGERRATSVRDWLVEEFDALSGDMFTIRSFGESDPVASNETAEGRQKNRRVEFLVLQGPERLEGTVDENGGDGGS